MPWVLFRDLAVPVYQRQPGHDRHPRASANPVGAVLQYMVQLNGLVMLLSDVLRFRTLSKAPETLWLSVWLLLVQSGPEDVGTGTQNVLGEEFLEVEGRQSLPVVRSSFHPPFSFSVASAAILTSRPSELQERRSLALAILMLQNTDRRSKNSATAR